MIQVKGLVKSFDDCKALNGLDLYAPKGCIYGLVGPNGAGKTTLINHLCGAYQHDSGSVEIDGSPVFENTQLKARIATIPSDIHYDIQSSIADQARLLSAVSPRFDMQRFKTLQAVFELEPKQPMRTLSRGMRKQAAFWLALSQTPDVLLLDEPVDGLDPIARHRVWSLLVNEVAERGMTVLASSHNLRELEDICDRVGIMDKGQMRIERDLSELQDNLVKVQLVLNEGQELPANLDVIHQSRMGRVQSLIVRGNQQQIEQAMGALTPLFFDVLPLSLEEIFIYELGGASDELINLVL